LNVIDLAIVLLFLVAILVIGFVSSHSVKKESDFYLGGRKLGRTLQFFLQFGNATDSTGAPTIATGVYRSGVGGAWLSGFQTLFISPFFWFTQCWYRRARVTTVADLFVDRFDSKSLATCYAAYNIFIALLTIGVGNVAAFKVASAMVVKPESEYTQADQQEHADYLEYQSLKQQVEAGTLSAQSDRFRTLDSQSKRGELQSSITYISRLPFYIAYSTVVGIYISLGGIRAAAVTDAVQGLLILAMSVLLIPVGLHAVGGFKGLHAHVPEYKFLLTSNTAWYAIVAIVVGSFLQVMGLMHNMSTGGSAANEDTARFGMIAGTFAKRLVLVAWIFCGLLAIGLLSGKGLSDPDLAWGQLSLNLLGPGLMGLMLSGMLLGHMPMVGVFSVSVAGLFTQNLYRPLVRGRSDRHYLHVAKFSIVLILIAAVIFAMRFSDLLEMYIFQVRYGIFFGAAMVVLYFWRRATAKGILFAFALWVIGVILIPESLSNFTAARQAPTLLAQTDAYVETTIAGATADDLSKGLADHLGQPVTRQHTVLPMALYFDKVARIDPRDPNSPVEGIGRFNVENYALHLLGFSVTHLHSSGLTTTGWLFDSVFPFLTIIAFSYLTRPGDGARSDRFFARMRTPVGKTPEDDRREVELSYQQPDRFDDTKIFRHSDWQFTKWNLKDCIGFFGCWVIVGLILLLLWGVLVAGS
jgi:SSS family solute:Na+ symporter